MCMFDSKLSVTAQCCPSHSISNTSPFLCNQVPNFCSWCYAHKQAAPSPMPSHLPALHSSPAPPLHAFVHAYVRVLTCSALRVSCPCASSPSPSLPSPAAAAMVAACFASASGPKCASAAYEHTATTPDKTIWGAALSHECE